jgi:uncharacterized protein YecE (DUF72 family)
MTGRAHTGFPFCRLRVEDETMKYLVGTCGFSYPEWKGVFYPSLLRSDAFLAFYASVFPAVEIDSTFYRMPTREWMRDLRNRSGCDLLFSVKAPLLLTHRIGDWEKDACLFRAAIEPLLETSSLSAVLFQFPQSFHYTPENRIYLSRLLALFPDFPSVVEFRSGMWMRQRVYEGLAERKAGICMSDMPSMRGVPVFDSVVTGTIGYVRFHGRNTAAWYGGDGAARYDYQYDDTELASFVSRIREMGKSSETVHLFFNNHPQGKATINARTMMDLLRKP